MPPGARPWNLSEESTLMCWRITAGSSFGIDGSGTAGAGSAPDEIVEGAGDVAAGAPRDEIVEADADVAAPPDGPAAGAADCAGASLRLQAAARTSTATAR